MPRRFAVLVAALLLLGCSGDDSGPSDPIALDDGDAATDPPGGGTDDAGDEDTGDEVDRGDGDGDDQGDEDGNTTAPRGDVVDASVAEPGTWQVGDAGTVTFSVDGDRLTLDDVTPSGGWTVREASADGDDLEVEFERSGESYTFEVELEDDATRLEVHIDHDLEGASPGRFELGAAGSITVSSEGDRLAVDDVTVADGWEVTERKEGGKKVELEVVRDEQRWQIKIEIDDDGLDVERDYRVTGGR